MTMYFAASLVGIGIGELLAVALGAARRAGCRAGVADVCDRLEEALGR